MIIGTPEVQVTYGNALISIILAKRPILKSEDHINLSIMKLVLMSKMLERENYSLNLAWVSVISRTD